MDARLLRSVIVRIFNRLLDFPRTIRPALDTPGGGVNFWNGHPYVFGALRPFCPVTGRPEARVFWGTLHGF